MAYSFLNTTTYTNQLAAQEQLLSEMIDAATTQSPLGAGFDLSSYDSDLVEIVSGDSTPQDGTQMSEDLMEQPEIDNSSEDEPEPDDRVDMELINSMFPEEPAPTPKPKTRTVYVEKDDEDDDNDNTRSYRSDGSVKPRIWKYGGKPSKYQFGGNENTLYADDYETQRIGLNDPNYSHAILNLEGTNTIRGLDSRQPVAVTDGKKYQVLYGPKDTAKFNGKVYEKRLNI